jgi:Ulp1 family protease
LNKQVLSNIRKYIETHCKLKNFVCTELGPKQLQCPQQDNGTDCGVFMLKYAEYVVEHKKLAFSANNIELFRKQMILQIVTNNLSLFNVI